MTDNSSSRPAIAFVSFGLALGAIEIGLSRFVWSPNHFLKYTWFLDRAMEGAPAWHRLPDLSPGYLAFLFATRPITNGSPAAIATLQLVLFGALVGLFGWAVARLEGLATGWMAAVTLGLARPVAVFATEVEPDFLLLVVHAAALLFVVAFASKRTSAASEWVAGGALALAFSLRPSALAGPGLAWGGALLLSSDPFRARLRTALRLAVPVAIVAFGTAFVVAKLSGSSVVMSPGAVLYSGFHARADGGAAVFPAAVYELEAAIAEPDAGHVAFRKLAAAAIGEPVSGREASRYWAGKALGWIAEDPKGAAALVLEKLAHFLGPPEAHDLTTTYDREWSMKGIPPLTWGLVLPWAIWGLVARRREPMAWIVALYAAGHSATLLASYASARYRLPLWAALAWLAAAGMLDVVGRFASLGRRAFVVGAIVAIELVLVVPGFLDSAASRRRAYYWHSTEQRWLAQEAARHAAERGSLVEMEDHLAAAYSLFPWQPPALPKGDGELAQRVAEKAWAIAWERIPTTDETEELFDALALARRTGHPDEAERLVTRLAEDSIRPFRAVFAARTLWHEAALTSVARDRRDEARERIRRALAESPGDLDVLALAARLEPDAAIRQQLDERAARLHDPVSVELARAAAAIELGDAGAARSALASARARLSGEAIGVELERRVNARTRAR